VCSLIREWGRIGQPGSVPVDLFATIEEAAAAQIKKTRKKLRKGYRQMSLFDGAT
jgi:predicted DNA-binding WGR domain protein